jgi:hypothetical protein
MSSTSRRLSVALFTAVLIVIGYALGVGQQQDRIRLSFARAQENAPVALLSVSSDPEYLFRTVTVRNRSSVRIDSLTLGVAVRAITPGSVPPPLAYQPGRPLGVSLQPGEFAKVEALTTTPAKVRELGRTFGPEIEAKLGLVHADLANGTTWDFDPVSKNGFAAFDSQAISVVPCHGSASRTLLSRVSMLLGPPVLAQGHFVCTTTADCLVCTNTGSSCTMSLCGQSGNPPCVNCPQQVCSYVG